MSDEQPVAALSSDVSPQTLTTPPPTKIHQCPNCEHIATSAGSLIFHRVNKHRKEFEAERALMPRDFECKRCGQKFESKWKLLAHNKKSHKRTATVPTTPAPVSVPISEKKSIAPEVPDMPEEEEKEEEEESDDASDHRAPIPSEAFFKGPAADAEDRKRRLESILNVLPGIKDEKRKWILYIWDNNPQYQQNPTTFFSFIANVKGVESGDAQRIVDAVFGSAQPSAQPPGYMPQYPQYPQPQQPYGYPQPYPPSPYPQPQYPQPYYPQPSAMSPADFERRLREEREKWEKDRDTEDLKGAVGELTQKIKDLSDPSKRKADGMITLRRQLLGGDGKPAVNADGTPAVEEVEMPAYQAAASGLMGQQQQNPQASQVDLFKSALQTFQSITPQKPAEDASVKEMRDKVSQMERDLADTRIKSEVGSVKSELGSKIDALTKQIEMEQQKQKFIVDHPPGAQKMDDAATVAIEEIKQNTSMFTTAASNLNNTLNTLIKVVGKANQTLPEGAEGASAEERERLRREFGNSVQ